MSSTVQRTARAHLYADKSMTSSEELADLGVRLARIRKLCDEFADALGMAEEQRALVAQLRTDADTVYQALTKAQRKTGSTKR